MSSSGGDAKLFARVRVEILFFFLGCCVANSRYGKNDGREQYPHFSSLVVSLAC